MAGEIVESEEEKMRRVSHEELDGIIEKHGKWLRGEEGGERADLRNVDLTGEDLSGVDLSWGKLSGARLVRASLRWADLTGVNLAGAIMDEAKL